MNRLQTPPHDPGRAGPEHALERMIFFSDAVFAIAITLLVIEIHVPHLPPHASDRDYLIALADLMPSFAGFIVSFFVIGAFWAGHHRSFACARTWDPRLFGVNLLLLLTIAGMPFFTAFAAAGPSHRVPVAAYCGWMLLTALLNMRLQQSVLSPPVVDPDVPASHRAALRRRGQAVALGAATSVVLALFYPLVGQMALATIPLWRRLLDRLASRRGPLSAA